MCDDEEGLPSRTEGPYKKGSSPGGSLNPDLTPSVPLESLNSSKNVFLHPLSFPEPQRKDISHFLYPSKDIPIACLFPTCAEVFRKAAIADDSDNGCAKDMGDLRVDSTEPERVNQCVVEGSGEDLEALTIAKDERAIDTETILLSSNSNPCSDGGIKIQTVTGGGMIKGDSGVLRFAPKDEWLRHLLLSHKMVIDRVDEISSLKSYSLYWRTRFSEAPVTEFAAVIRTNSSNSACYDPPDNYYLLSDVLPEDKQLRELLQRKKLEAILLTQQREREDRTFSRTCLFCSHLCSGNRSVLFQHMLDMHGFNVGQPDNLVFVNEFLDLLKQKLDNFQCLYCERLFRDYQMLKEHMRKKQHKKISSQNHTYDRFYVINYLELGKNWEEVQAEDDREILPQVEESEWNDWQEEDGQDVLIFCLFCPISSEDFRSTLDHMSAAHGFHYHDNCRRHKLDYYGQVKAINYIRRQVHVHCCCFCMKRCSSHEELTEHMSSMEHFKLPGDKSTWNQSQYFFPTFENDAFLCALDEL